jgi:uncharacterized protein YbcI
MATAFDSTRSDASGAMKLAALSDALVRLHKEICGRGPNNARCMASGNAVVCLMFDGLTHAEQTLLDRGDSDGAKTVREALHQVMKRDARAIAEEQLARRVTAMTIAADPANGLETVVFLLDSPPDL